MTKVENSGTPSNRSQQRKRRPKKDKMKPPTKIVVRHLPPTMTEEEFLKQIEMPDHDFFYYSPADWSLGNCATCRAYVTLKRYEDVFLFRDRFDGYVFVDSKGAEYPAIVEFAPFQGLVKNRSRRSDNKANSIEQEQHYQQFLAKLEEEREAAAKGSEIKLEFSLDRKKEEITSTPLLQYLANKKEKRREEAKKRTEEKRRQREEEKERRREKQQPQVTKIITSQSGGGVAGKVNNNNSGGGNNNITENRNKDGGNVDGERKNSRAKRKAEREQRRKEQREKAKAEENEKPLAERKANENKGTDQTANEDKTVRESKKYSEKRERDRNRNRRDKDKQNKETSGSNAAAVKILQTSITSTAAETSVQSGSSNEMVTVKQKSKDEQISETVCNFIRSVANVKEFIPKHKQQQLQQQSLMSKSEDNKLNESELLTKPVMEKSHDIPKNMEASTSSKVELTERQKEQQLRREERRIRNKDRPSIAIYTPKPRHRVSEESDSNVGAGKESRSNNTSDCESSKKEEVKTKKKVSRYSERRIERQNSTAAQLANLTKSGEFEDAANRVVVNSAENIKEVYNVDCTNQTPTPITTPTSD